MKTFAKVLIIVEVLAISQFAYGQWRGGGGGRGGRDDNGPISADEMKQRLSRSEEFLKRLDANHNGMIEAGEAEEGGGMLDRMFGRMGQKPSYPVAINEIMKNYEAYYRTRLNGGSGGSSPTAGGMSFGGTPSGGTVPFGPPSGSGMQSPPGMGFGPPPSSGSSSGPPSSSSDSRRGKSGRDYGPPSGGSSASGPSGSGAGPGSTSASSSSGAADSKLTGPKSGRFLTVKERLPKGLPDWFTEKDVNGDGQVEMSEYTTRWTPEKAADFARYDLNHDGIITADECLKSEKPKGSSK